MNSKGRAHPEGIGASSGMLGHYLMDHSAGNVYFYMPDVRDDGGKYDLLGSDSIMIPRYQNLGATREQYLRGFGIWGGIQRLPVPAFLRKHPAMPMGFLCGRSETLPHFDNRVELDPEVKDAWGSRRRTSSASGGSTSSRSPRGRAAGDAGGRRGGGGEGR